MSEGSIKSERERVPYWDNIKGILILLVVLAILYGAIWVRVLVSSSASYISSICLLLFLCRAF